MLNIRMIMVQHGQPLNTFIPMTWRRVITMVVGTMSPHGVIWWCLYRRRHPRPIPCFVGIRKLSPVLRMIIGVWIM